MGAVICRGALLLVIAASDGVFALPAPAGRASPVALRIAFYGEIGNIINSQNPLLVRPATLLLAEDGCLALVQLHGIGWGKRIVRASGIFLASDCTPSCTTGKLTGPARLTLSSPGWVAGHRMYRCFRVTAAHRRFNENAECPKRHGNFYLHTPVVGPPAPIPRLRSPLHLRSGTAPGRGKAPHGNKESFTATPSGKTTRWTGRFSEGQGTLPRKRVPQGVTGLRKSPGPRREDFLPAGSRTPLFQQKLRAGGPDGRAPGFQDRQSPQHLRDSPTLFGVRAWRLHCSFSSGGKTS